MSKGIVGKRGPVYRQPWPAQRPVAVFQSKPWMGGGNKGLL